MKSFSRWTLCGALVAAQLSCVDSSPDRRQAQPRLMVSGPSAPSELHSGATHHVPPDRLLTYIAPRPDYLPRWKTEWEQELERMAGSGAASLPNADQFDDYRNLHIDKFFTTKPPVTAGIRPPGEYEPSQAYLLHWAQYTQAAWIKLFGEIVQGAWGIVPVLMIYKDAAHKTWIEGQLTALGYGAAAIQDPKNIIWWQHTTNAIWSRDYGPVSIVDSPTTGSPTLSFVDFRYYHARQYDDEIPNDLAQQWGINDFRPDLDFEGGNFMSTAEGLCAATKGVLYYNLQFSQSAVEQIFKDYLGCKTSLFPATMKGGVIAHIDMFSKFASDTTMLVGEYQASQDVTNKAILDANAQLFASTPTPGGKTMLVTRIPMPGHKGFLGLNVWRTYTNSLSLVGPSGKVVLIPVYVDETTHETAALAAYAAVYPGWTLVPIASDIIIPGQGAIHCITMQIPEGAKAKMESDPPDLCGATKFKCAATACSGIPPEGCCSGDMLKYCASGSLKASDCAGSPKCGWDPAKGQYQCGTSGTPDPSGAFPISCDVVNDAGAPDGLGADQGGADVGADAGQPDLAPADTLPADQAPSTDAGRADGKPAGDGAQVGGGDGCSCSLGAQRSGAPPAALVLFALVGLLARRRLTARASRP